MYLYLGKLSENIWFVWSKMSCSGDMEGCYACAHTDNARTECEDRARILETEFAIEGEKEEGPVWGLGPDSCLV